MEISGKTWNFVSNFDVPHDFIERRLLAGSGVGQRQKYSSGQNRKDVAIQGVPFHQFWIPQDAQKRMFQARRGALYGIGTVL